ncbi:MAG: biotin--[acetyl-CoA-carboxylase] ligase, partial [Acidimicrobiia bacterium]
GVLAEADGHAVVVGIGINLRRAPEGAAFAGVEREPLLAGMLEHLAHWYGRWDDVALEYRRRCSTIGEEVRVEMADETFTGTALDINPDGHLLVDVGSGTHEVVAGDVVHVRPTA